mmetsp:Transcript_13907/g.34294  ORF Transcript_13907/g.34294 Transcript_13907/m.34294 type:complete len:133 (-) Transcript_13907:46-444(-)
MTPAQQAAFAAMSAAAEGIRNASKTAAMATTPKTPTAAAAAADGASASDTEYVLFDARIGDRHPEIACDSCSRLIGSATRFHCLDCADFDLCGLCVRHGRDELHHGGVHVFAKLGDSRRLQNGQLNQYHRSS